MVNRHTATGTVKVLDSAFNDTTVTIEFSGTAATDCGYDAGVVSAKIRKSALFMLSDTIRGTGTIIEW